MVPDVAMFRSIYVLCSGKKCLKNVPQDNISTWRCHDWKTGQSWTMCENSRLSGNKELQGLDWKEQKSFVWFHIILSEKIFLIYTLYRPIWAWTGVEIPSTTRASIPRALSCPSSGSSPSCCAGTLQTTTHPVSCSETFLAGNLGLCTKAGFLVATWKFTSK